MKPLVYRQDKLFKIDIEQLSPKAKRTEIINTLYAAIYNEFIGAIYNTKYANMNYKDRMEAVNNFAHNWLETKGLK